MKKFISVSLSLLFIVLMFVGCSNSSKITYDEIKNSATNLSYYTNQEELDKITNNAAYVKNSSGKAYRFTCNIISVEDDYAIAYFVEKYKDENGTKLYCDRMFLNFDLYADVDTLLQLDTEHTYVVVGTLTGETSKESDDINGQSYDTEHVFLDNVYIEQTLDKIEY